MMLYAKLIKIAESLTAGDTDCGDVSAASALRVASELLAIASDLRSNMDDEDAR